MNRTLQLLAAAGAVSLIGFGAAGCTTDGDRTSSASVSFDDVTLDRLTIKATSADVTVTEGDKLEVRSVTQNAPKGGESEPTLEGDVLTLPFDCTGVSLGCEADYTVTVPAGVEVAIENSGGDVEVAGFSARLTISAHKGDVSLGGVSSPQITITGRDGDIEGTALTAGSVHASVRNADVELEFASAPQTVDVRGEDGDVSIELPAERYAITAESRKGNVEITAGRDDASSKSINVITTGGDIEIR